MAATASLSCYSSPLPRRRSSISASISERPNTAAPPSSSTSKLPIRKIPGDYGLPLVGPIRDRLAYFYSPGGRDEFLKSKIRRYNSTVFRVNVPPGPLIARDPRVVALCDAVSFPVLFDTSLVDKTDLFTGTFMPSTELTGGYRVLSYLDPSEPNHAPLKKILFYMLSSRRSAIIPEFVRTFGDLFDELESKIAGNGKADFSAASDQASFNFLVRSLLGSDPEKTALGKDGPSLIMKWVLFQIGPLLTLGLPSFVEDLTLHSFRLPPALIKKDYNRLADFFREASTAIFEEADKVGVSQEEALHNIIFSICFNSFGGMKILFPGIIKWVGRAGARLHGKLAEEVRAALHKEDNIFKAIESMPLVKSVVYEALRIEPPVALQHGRVKRDMVVESHDAAFEVRAGELLFGYQPFATKDPRIFERAEEFVADRFTGEQGKKLLKYVVWSNGPETEAPTAENKQCAGKDFVVLVARLLVVELFRRYDSFDIQVGTSALGSSIQLTSLKKATF